MNYEIDAKNKKLGRLSSEIAQILQGKKGPSYDPRLLSGDKVTVKNASGMVMTGKKTAQKIYYRHAGPLGHLKENKFTDVFKKNPAWVLRHAVRLMLPKNRLNAKRLKNLTVER
jgi:large subunit ribosomal protein L13